MVSSAVGEGGPFVPLLEEGKENDTIKRRRENKFTTNGIGMYDNNKESCNQ